MKVRSDKEVTVVKDIKHSWVPKRVSENNFEYKVLDRLLHGLESAPGQANAILSKLPKDQFPLAWFITTYSFPIIMIPSKDPIRASITGILKNFSKTQLYKDLHSSVALSDGSKNAIVFNAVGDGLGELVLHDSGVISSNSEWSITYRDMAGTYHIQTLDTFADTVRKIKYWQIPEI